MRILIVCCLAGASLAVRADACAVEGAPLVLAQAEGATQKQQQHMRSRGGTSEQQPLQNPMVQQILRDPELQDDPRFEALMQGPQMQRLMQNPQLQRQMQQNQQLRQMYQLQHRPLPGVAGGDDED